MKRVSQAKRAECLLMLQNGKSTRTISKELGISLGTISSIRSTSPLQISNRAGPPRVLSARDRQRLVRLVLSGKADNASQLKKLMELKCSTQTIRNALRSEGLAARVKVKMLHPALRSPSSVPSGLRTPLRTPFLRSASATPTSVVRWLVRTTPIRRSPVQILR
jgi:transposase